LFDRYRQAQALGGDIGKLAVMPRSSADVLALLQATLQASSELAIPVAGMSMGALGAVTRLAGGEFGSALTFAVGQAASAPGQLPIEELRRALALLRRGSVG
jgi:3-dehydroquinate dehydratase I